MSRLDIPLTDAGLDVLDEHLAPDRSPPGSMLLSNLDGFLIGIAIGSSA